MFPLISEYIEAIKSAEDNFDELKYLRPVLDEDGGPVMSGGNFAVVFKMKDVQTGKLHAVKCFLKEQEGRAEAYRMIAEELEYVNSTFLTPIKYLDKELFVDSKNSDETEFPVLLMDWVEGKTLDKYIQKHVNRYLRAECLDEVSESEEKAIELLVNSYELENIAYQFSCLAIWLLQQPFAHGDLKPDNIIVKEDGTLVLVDYDGMYVPAMRGQKARELGSPDFRHPLRNENDFDEHIDDFPLSSILLSLLAIANEPSLLEKYGGDGRLLLSERDYRNIAESEVLDALRPLMADKNLTTYLSLFYLCSAQKSLFKESYHLFTLSEPEKPYFMVEDEDLSTEVTAYDWNNRLEDEYGGVYSYDGRKLLAFGSYDYAAKIYKIKDGTRVICDLAFNNYENDNHFLKGVYIPSSVIAIGKGVFAGCTDDFEIICDSPFFEVDAGLLYNKTHTRLIACLDSSKQNIVIDPRVDTIGAYCFSFCEIETIFLSKLVEIEEHAIDSVDSIIIPSGMKTEFEKRLPKYKDNLVEQEENCGNELTKTHFDIDLKDFLYMLIRRYANELILCFEDEQKEDLDKKLLYIELTILLAGSVLDFKNENINNWFVFAGQKILNDYLSLKVVDDFDKWIEIHTPGMCSDGSYTIEEAISLAEFEEENGQVKFFKGNINAYPYDESFWGEFVDNNGRKQIIYVNQGFPLAYNVSELSKNKTGFGIIKEKETYYHGDEFVFCLKEIKKKHSMLPSYINKRLFFYRDVIEEAHNQEQLKAYSFQLYNALTNEITSVH